MRSSDIGVDTRPLIDTASVSGPSIATDSTVRVGNPALIADAAPTVTTGPGRRPPCDASLTSTIDDASARSPDELRTIIVIAPSPRSALRGMAAVTDRSIDSPRCSNTRGTPTMRAFHNGGPSTDRSSVSS